MTSAMTICTAEEYFQQLSAADDEDAMDILSETGGAAAYVTHQLITKYHKKVCDDLRLRLFFQHLLKKE